MDRPNADVYFMLIAFATSLRGTCERRQVGAVLVKEGRIISTGYNGSPPGFEHCKGQEFCSFGSQGCKNTIHAETNAIARAREQGDTIYCTDTPCLSCLKMIISHNKNIKIIWCRRYDDPDRDSFIEAHNVKCVTRMSDEDIESLERYSNVSKVSELRVR